MGNRWLKNSFVYLLVIIALVAIAFAFLPGLNGTEEKPISDVFVQARAGKVEKIVVEGDRVNYTTTDNVTFHARKEPGSSIMELLAREDIDSATIPGGIAVKGSSGLGNFFGVMIQFLPLILLGVFLLFMMRQAQGSSNQTLSFGRSRARLFVGNRPSVSFSDVAGADEAKAELQEVVEFLKFPERFMALGARIPKGVLLVGPPGTGKTLLARAVAGEAGVPFFSISGSEFVEMFVGVGAARVRDLFEQAKRNSPCIVFVDEIDAVGRHRGAGMGGGHDEREQTLNQILVEMDGFDTNTNVIVIAATNRPDILDPALLRPGRFDRRVTLDAPDLAGRLAILKVHTRGKPIDPEVNLEVVAKQTPGFSGADLANLVNEAAILAARRQKKIVTLDEFEEAIDRIVAGPERKSRLMTPHEKKMTAYHEAGHALSAFHMPNADTVHKISIVSRGSMGGYTRLLPPEDRNLMTQSQFEAMMAVAMGGRVAEEIVFGDVSTGASNDLERATQVARHMVTRFGMSELLGPRVYGKRQELVFLGKELNEERDYSLRTETLIDREVDRLLRTAYQRAKDILVSHRPKLDQITKYLVEHESVEGPELARLFSSPTTEEPQQPAPPRGSVVAEPPPTPAAEREAPPRRAGGLLPQPPKPGPQAMPG